MPPRPESISRNACPCWRIPTTEFRSEMNRAPEKPLPEELTLLSCVPASPLGFSLCRKLPSATSRARCLSAASQSFVSVRQTTQPTFPVSSETCVSLNLDAQSRFADRLSLHGAYHHLRSGGSVLKYILDVCAKFSSSACFPPAVPMSANRSSDPKLPVGTRILAQTICICLMQLISIRILYRYAIGLPKTPSLASAPRTAFPPVIH